jgi:ATP-dependent exoDNAse (exonuclease V) beta subunit
VTLIVKKYEYRPLKRVEIDGKRRYDWGGDIPVPSVTTILSETKDQTHLIEWRKRVGEQKAKEITTEAAGVGTRMHKYLEDYIATGEWPSPGSNPYAQKAHAMATRIKVHALDDVNEIWGSEVALYMPKLYAGTTDLVGVYKGNPCIMDFKQSNKVKKKEWIEDYYLQMTAYALAHNEIHGTNIREGHVFMCTRDEQYLQFDLWPDEFDDWSNKWWERVYNYYEKCAK